MSQCLFNHVVLLCLKDRKDQRQGKIKVNTDWSLRQQLFILLPLLSHDFCQNKWRWRRHDFRQNLSPASSVLSSGSGLWFITYDRHFTSLTTDLCQEVYQSWPIERQESRQDEDKYGHPWESWTGGRERDVKKHFFSFHPLSPKSLIRNSWSLLFSLTSFSLFVLLLLKEENRLLSIAGNFLRDCAAGFLECMNSPWQSLYDSRVLIVILMTK